MNQVADILELANLAQQQNVDAVLATVVRTEGSAYRHVGAMMLICADGRSVGMISGGCLEPHIIKRAFWLTRNGANVQVYQTGDEQRDYGNDDQDSAEELDIDSDDELNFGLGCNGKVHVLFERLTFAMPLLALINQVRRDQQPITIATLIKFDGVQSKESEPQIGMRINIDTYRDTGELTTVAGDQLFSDPANTVVNPIFAQTVKTLSRHKFYKRNTDYVVVKADIEDNLDKCITDESQQNLVQTEWLIQRIDPQKRLLICGAGNDVMPLVTMAKLQDWHVTVIDSRQQYATHTRFPQADTVKCLSLEDTEALIKLSNGAAVAVMSHSLSQDRARLTVLLAQASCSYLGQLGPRYRTERLIEEISASIANPSLLDQGIAKLYYPIGYKLGSDGPEALALSIMAQISAVIHGQESKATSLDNKHNLQASKQPLTEHDYTDGHKSDYAHH